MAKEKQGNSNIINHSIGINTHMGYQYYDYDYRKEISTSIGELNLGMVRDYIYNNSKNSAKRRVSIFNNVLYNLKKCAPNIEVLGVLHDRRWEVDKDVPLSTFLDLVKIAVRTYDGKSTFIPSDYGNEMSYEIKYWEICNELDWISYGKPPFETIDKVFELIKSTYIAIKAINPRAKVVFPGIANIKNKFVEDIFDYKDENGKRVWDFFDVFNFHYYPVCAEELISALKNINEHKRKYGWDKPVWLTEIGWSEFHNNEVEVAINLPKAYLMAFSNGVERVFWFQHRRFDYDCGVDASFGLLRSSLDATYISLTSGGEPFSKGTAYNHILVNSKQLSIPLLSYSYNQPNKSRAEYLLFRLQKNGLVISGDNYSINKVSIQHANNKGVACEEIVFEKDTNKQIVVLPSYFNNCSIYDTIKISFKDFKKDLKWKEADKTMAYCAMMVLLEKLPNGSSHFSFESKDGVYVCRWLDNTMSPMMAIWCRERKRIKLAIRQRLVGTTYLGEKLSITPESFYLNKSIIFLNGHYNYKIVN